jgi:glutathionylspermidine synthase
MERRLTAPRANLEARLKERAFDGVEASFTSPFWRDDAYYRFTAKQVDELEDATNALYKMCLHAVDHVIRTGQLDRFGIPSGYHPYIKKAWDDKQPAIYGRFDLAYDGKSPPKMLEFNSDTPTSLYEAAVLQWDWLVDRRDSGDVKFKGIDQFNSIHEKLVDTWKRADTVRRDGPVHFTCYTESLEDYCTTAYMEETAYQAGRDTRLIDISEIGINGKGDFADNHGDGDEIKTLFKLYPWEMMMEEEYGPLATADVTQMLEPIWKSLLCNKAILPVLWELYPGHKNLLPAHMTPEPFGDKPYVKKAILGREGANVEICNSEHAEKSEGEYGETGYVYQGYQPLPEFFGRFPIIGSWVVGGESCGMGIREDSSRITKNTSNFIPHMFVA